MKAFKKIKLLCILLFILLSPISSFAGGALVPQLISKIQISGGAIYIYGASGDWGDPDVCGSGSIERIPILDTVANFPEKYALLVASYLQGHPISVYSNHCTTVSGISYPEVSSITSSLP